MSQHGTVPQKLDKKLLGYSSVLVPTFLFTLGSTFLTSYFCIFGTPKAHFPRFSFENETIVTFRATKSAFNIRQTE